MILALIGFGTLIAVHEFGHFLFARLFGIKAPTFSIGFGPEIFKKKIGETDFRLALIPLGGYVEIAGLAEAGQGEQAHASLRGSESFRDKPYWQQLLVLLGGILFNMLFAYGALCSLYLVGTSEGKAIFVSGMVKNGPAETAGFIQGDGVIKVGESNLIDEQGNLKHNAEEIMLSEIRSNPNKTVDFGIIRYNQNDKKYESITLPVNLGERPDGNNVIGVFGAGLSTPIHKLPFFEAIKAGVKHTNYFVIKIVDSVKKLFTSRSLEGAAGPVMIISMSFNSAQNSFAQLLVFLAIVSVNLALMNVLPIGVLDGGQFVFCTIEAIIRRPLPILLRNIINISSWLLFISLALWLTYQDIVQLFGKNLMGIYSKLLSLIGW